MHHDSVLRSYISTEKILTYSYHLMNLSQKTNKKPEIKRLILKAIRLCKKLSGLVQSSKSATTE